MREKPGNRDNSLVGHDWIVPILTIFHLLVEDSGAKVLHYQSEKGSDSVGTEVAIVSESGYAWKGTCCKRRAI